MSRTIFQCFCPDSSHPLSFFSSTSRWIHIWDPDTSLIVSSLIEPRKMNDFGTRVIVYSGKNVWLVCSQLKFNPQHSIWSQESASSTEWGVSPEHCLVWLKKRKGKIHDCFQKFWEDKYWVWKANTVHSKERVKHILEERLGREQCLRWKTYLHKVGKSWVLWCISYPFLSSCLFILVTDTAFTYMNSVCIWIPFHMNRDFWVI